MTDDLAKGIAKGALRIEWKDTESAARKVAEYAADRIEELEALRDALTNKIHKLVFLLDDQLGTPCEQIRHQQQVEELEAKLDKAVEMLRVLGVHPIVLAELKGETDE